MRANEERKQREELKATLKLLEKKILSAEKNQCLCDKCERDLERLYDNIPEGLRIRSRCQ